MANDTDCPEQQVKISLLGLDGAGKTALLKRLKLDEGFVSETMPTVGFNAESVDYEDVRFNIFDLGGQKQLRPLWRNYLPETAIVIFVVDSADVQRLEESAKELHKILDDTELQHATVLILANKQDLPNALDINTIKEHLKIIELQQKCHILGTSVKDGTGLIDALKFLHLVLKEKK